MAASAAIAIDNPFKCGFYSSPQGFYCSTRRFHLRTYQNVRRARRGTITAKVDHKPPPYPLDSLEPHMSRQTFEDHWGKHHRAYVDNLNKQIVGTELEAKTLDEIILDTVDKIMLDTTDNEENLLEPLITDAAQVWNHEFFWESMKPGGGGKPSGELLDLINRDFGSFEEFVTQFKTFAADLDGSGWAWLVYKENKLKAHRTEDYVNPLVFGHSALLAIDLWEHAYYLDFQNRKADYISTFMEKLVSWDAVSSRLEAAQAEARAAAR